MPRMRLPLHDHLGFMAHGVLRTGRPRPLVLHSGPSSTEQQAQGSLFCWALPDKPRSRPPAGDRTRRRVSTWPSERSVLRKSPHQGVTSASPEVWALLRSAEVPATAVRLLEPPAPGELGERGQAPHGVMLQGEALSVSSVPSLNVQVGVSPRRGRWSLKCFPGRSKLSGSQVRLASPPRPRLQALQRPGHCPPPKAGSLCSWQGAPRAGLPPLGGATSFATFHFLNFVFISGWGRFLGTASLGQGTVSWGFVSACSQQRSGKTRLLGRAELGASPAGSPPTPPLGHARGSGSLDRTVVRDPVGVLRRL